MTREDILELLDEDAIFYDGLDSAIVGVADRFGMPTVVCYDKQKCLEALKNTFSDVELDEDEIESGMTVEDKKEEMAIEWFDYNIIGGYNGEYTPVFITTNID